MKCRVFLRKAPGIGRLLKVYLLMNKYAQWRLRYNLRFLSGVFCNELADFLVLYMKLLE